MNGNAVVSSNPVVSAETAKALLAQFPTAQITPGGWFSKTGSRLAY
ncbi:hypothetical protein [Shigella flexneri]|nr:hypothetical protein [Shigella flexneri]